MYSQLNGLTGTKSNKLPGGPEKSGLTLPMSPIFLAPDSRNMSKAQTILPVCADGNNVSPNVVYSQGCDGNDCMLPPHEIMVHLVEVFFEAVQPHFPMLHRPSFLKRLYNKTLLNDSCTSVLLHAMYALAARFTDDSRVHDYDVSLVQTVTGSDTIHRPDTLQIQRLKCSERGKGFMRCAGILLQKELNEFDENPELDTNVPLGLRLTLIQAITMLSHAELISGAINRASSLISTSVRMAYDLALDRVDAVENARKDSCNLNSDGGLEGLRRVWWCLWELESFVCSLRGHPRTINTGRCRTKLPVDDVDWLEDHNISSVFLPSSLDEWQQSWRPEQGHSVFANRIISLHFLRGIIKLVDSDDVKENVYGSSDIEQTAVIWRNGLPTKFKSTFRVQNALNDPSSVGTIVPIYMFIEQ